MHLRLIDYVLWFSAPILQIGILWAMWVRGLHRKYPWFAWYTLLQILTEPVLFVLRPSYYAYYCGYWLAVLIATLMSAAVVYEVARTPFRRDVPPPRRAAFWFVALLSFLIALTVGWAVSSFHPGEWKAEAFRYAMFVAEGDVRLLQCGLLALLLIFARRLGLKYGDLAIGIALGFAVFASVGLLVRHGMSHPGIVSIGVMRWAKSAAYVLACLIWLAYALTATVAKETAPS